MMGGLGVVPLPRKVSRQGGIEIRAEFHWLTLPLSPPAVRRRRRRRVTYSCGNFWAWAAKPPRSTETTTAQQNPSKRIPSTHGIYLSIYQVSIYPSDWLRVEQQKALEGLPIIAEGIESGRFRWEASASKR